MGVEEYRKLRKDFTGEIRRTAEPASGDDVRREWQPA